MRRSVFESGVRRSRDAGSITPDSEIHRDIPKIENVSAYAAECGRGFICTINGELWGWELGDGWQKIELPEDAK